VANEKEKKTIPPWRYFKRDAPTDDALPFERRNWAVAIRAVTPNGGGGGCVATEK
jgi:hypothetical protein